MFIIFCFVWFHLHQNAANKSVSAYRAKEREQDREELWQKLDRMESNYKLGLPVTSGKIPTYKGGKVPAVDNKGGSKSNKKGGRWA